MHIAYEDIVSRINEEPTWYDNNGVPRYGKYSPDRCPNIYAQVTGLFLIKCQYCNKEFQVEMHSDIFGFRSTNPPTKWHYGDPPLHGCTGDTMNCIDIEVLEFWQRKDFGKEWKRLKSFEKKME